MITFFIGRWQPFHNGHKYLIDSYVNNGLKVCIGIRNMGISYSNPYTPEQVRKMIDAVYRYEIKNGLMSMVILPNITQVVVGRGVGYGILTVPKEIEDISATKVRAGDLSSVPDAVQEVMDEIRGGQ